jgi:hypothetical protein
VSLKELLLRMRISRGTAMCVSRDLWQRQEVPVEMVIRQGSILRLWDELQKLGGQRA